MNDPMPSASAAPGPAYLTPDQVAELLQVASKTIYDWARKDPTMPVLRIGHAVRFPRERLMQWLRDREQGRARTRSLSAVASKPALDKESARA